MIEQFLDFCGLYPLGRYVRGFTKGFSYDKDGFAKGYKAEEHKGVVLLQREKRLTDRRKEILSAIEHQKQQQDAKFGDRVSSGTKKVFDELYDIDEKLLELRNLWHAHEVEIRRLLSLKKNNAYHREVIMAGKHQYSFIPGHDKPYIWVKAKHDCARTGGCCGRECGCCEKPLKLYSTASSFLSRKKKVGVYGHCTAECGCCIKHIGGYTPHPLFTESEKKAKKR